MAVIAQNQTSKGSGKGALASSTVSRDGKTSASTGRRCLDGENSVARTILGIK